MNPREEAPWGHGLESDERREHRLRRRKERERERRASETAEQREVRLRIRRERDRARRASQSVEGREALPSAHQATLYQWTQLDHSNTFTLAKTSIEMTHTTVV